jgi:hypothetical protein
MAKGKSTAGPGDSPSRLPGGTTVQTEDRRPTRAATPKVDLAARPTSSLAEELRFLFVNTRDPQGHRWSLQRVANEAARYGEEMSRAHVHSLLTGKVENTSLRKVQVLGMVFGVGSMGLIHPLEPQAEGQPEQEAAARKVLEEMLRHTGIIEKALSNAKLQRAVLLLDGYQSEETLEQAARIIEELGEMEKRFLGKPKRRPPEAE